MYLEKFDKFLKTVDLKDYRKKYSHIKIVEMDLSKDIQAGEFRLPYLRFLKDKRTVAFKNGFVVFTPYAFEGKKKEIDNSLK